jgi:hypothetical protein
MHENILMCVGSVAALRVKCGSLGSGECLNGRACCLFSVCLILSVPNPCSYVPPARLRPSASL